MTRISTGSSALTLAERASPSIVLEIALVPTQTSKLMIHFELSHE